MKRRELLKCAAALAAIRSAGAFAQGGTARIIAGFAPGTGVVDAVSRLLAEKMKGDYAPTLIVENRVGVGGQLAAAALKQAPADGTVMLVAPMSNFSVHPHIYDKIAYDPFKDFVPVGNCATADLALAVGAGVPEQVTTVPQLIAWYKANPGKTNFATGVTGSKIHFSGVKLGMSAGVPLTHVGYSNGSNALTDLVSGTVPAYIGTVASVIPFLNRIRVIATMGTKRSQFLPNVATLVEQGYKDVVVDETVAMFLLAGVPERIVQRLHASMTKVLSLPETVATLSTAGVDVAPSSGAEVLARMKAEYQEWGALVKQIGFKQTS